VLGNEGREFVNKVIKAVAAEMYMGLKLVRDKFTDDESGA